jgi:transcriptional regulator with XRE-family HTH domain
MPRLFGEKMRNLRRQRGLTQVELAQRLGLAGHTHVGKLEASRDVPSLDLALRLAHVFGVSTDYLLRDTVSIANNLLPADTLPEDEGLPRLFGAKLFALRQARGWSQRDLTRRLGLTSRAYISDLEAGRKLPSIDLVVRLADLFGVATDDLLRDSKAIQDSMG